MSGRVGQHLGNYRLLRLLGKGGFAEVYLGEHIHLTTQAAIKVLLAHLGSQADMAGFRREAQAIARLTHPHIVRVLVAVEQVVLRALAKDPKERFPTVQAFATALSLAVQSEQDVSKFIKPGNQISTEPVTERTAARVLSHAEPGGITPSLPSARASSRNIGDPILGALQSAGRSFMFPIALLSAAGLLLRFGQPDLLNLPWMAAMGGAVFDNLSLIFAISIAFSLTGGEGVGALAGLVGFLIFNGVFKAIIPQVNGAPDPTISMGVLSGILVGLVSVGLYRRYYDIRLPDFLAFFGGKRFVPIITALAALILGAIFGLIWPPIQGVINAIGQGIVGLGPLGTGLYGFLNRLLIPLGLHHVLNTYIWFQLGTYHGAHGVVNGDLNRYFAGDPTAGNFMAGFFPIMMFGLPAACLAMIRHARFPKVAAGILLSAALTSFVAGVTEPIEFAFLFVAPVLFLVHAILTGTAFAVCTILDIRIGFGFSAGLIDYLINFSKSNTHNPLLLLVVGLIYAVLYYFVFSFFITRFNLGTPGRGEATTGLRADKQGKIVQVALGTQCDRIASRMKRQMKESGTDGAGEPASE
jgi:N-acetylglucosamine PTS system EIICBA or EIICB component